MHALKKYVVYMYECMRVCVCVYACACACVCVCVTFFYTCMVIINERSNTNSSLWNTKRSRAAKMI